MSSKSSMATLASRVQLMTWDTRHVRSIGMATSSSQYLHGCPTFVWMSPPCASALSAAHESLAWKLERDDTLIQYCAQLWEWCQGKGIQIAIENPGASRLWASPVWLRFCAAPGICEVALQQCMFGASRDKWSKIVSTSDKLTHLAKTCEKSHAHEHWSEAHFQRSLRGAGGGYPVGLCKAFEACICGQGGGRVHFPLSPVR